MAVSRGRADERDIYRAMIVDEYTDASWSEYLREQSRADNGRSPTTPSIVPDGGQLVEPEHPQLHVGDHVTDREDDEDGATMLVVGTPPEQAIEYTVGGETIAAYNPEYPETDDVVEVVYPQRTDVEITRDTYAFPRSRLRLVAPIHDRDEGDENQDDRGEWIEDDHGDEVPRRSEPADFGGGDSTGVQDL